MILDSLVTVECIVTINKRGFDLKKNQHNKSQEKELFYCT